MYYFILLERKQNKNFNPGNLHWFSKMITCMPNREKDWRKLYVTDVFFFWKIFVTYGEK